MQCGSAVAQVIVRKGRAVGVRTTSGETFDAGRAVIADVSAPALYRELVGEEHLPLSVVSDISEFQWDMSTLKVDWALDSPVPWSASDARRAGTAPSIEGLRRSLACARGRWGKPQLAGGTGSFVDDPLLSGLNNKDLNIVKNVTKKGSAKAALTQI